MENKMTKPEREIIRCTTADIIVASLGTTGNEEIEVDPE